MEFSKIYFGDTPDVEAVVLVCVEFEGRKGRGGSDAKTKAHRRVPLRRSLLKDYSSLVDRINLPDADIRPRSGCFRVGVCTFT
jgi:hypothetical protein